MITNPTALEERIVTAKGLPVRMLVSGPVGATPMVLMHGWGCKAETLASIQRVAEATHRVYNIDFPGFGKTPEPPEPWNVSEYTEMVRELVNALDLKDPVMLGHSFGGRVGILYASMYPVSKLILVDAAGVKPVRTLKYYVKVYTFKALKWLAPKLLGKKRGQKMIDNWRKRAGSADYSSSSPMMQAILSKVVNSDLRSVMPKIKAPTLLIWGENDTATPMRDAHIMEDLIPNAGLVSFPACGHYSFLDNRLQFNAVLDSFLRS